jgi:hypothetical protein
MEVFPPFPQTPHLGPCAVTPAREAYCKAFHVSTALITTTRDFELEIFLKAFVMKVVLVKIRA